MYQRQFRISGGEERLYPRNGIMHLKGTVEKVELLSGNAMAIHFSVQDQYGYFYPSLVTVLSGDISKNTLFADFFESTSFFQIECEYRNYFTEEELNKALCGNNALLAVDTDYNPPLIKAVNCACMLEDYGYSESDSLPSDF